MTAAIIPHDHSFSQITYYIIIKHTKKLKYVESTRHNNQYVLKSIHVNVNQLDQITNHYLNSVCNGKN